MNTTSKHRAGYRVTKIYVAHQEYKSVVDEASLQGIPASERVVNFGWDWRPIGSRTFEVLVNISVEPVEEAPESISVHLAGVFAADETDLTIPFAEFVRVNATAILFPYARELVSSISGHGPYGAFHVEPVNVAAMAKSFDLALATGSVFLDSNPEIATDFGLDYHGENAMPATPPALSP